MMNLQSKEEEVIDTQTFPQNGPSTVHQVRPLLDNRWVDFVHRCPHSTIFHTRPWLEALHKTYGYEPVVFTTSPPGAVIENGLLFCRVNSWLTGRRLVSLPFSDSCEPLVEDVANMHNIFSAVEQEVLREKLLYAEIRQRRQMEVLSSLIYSNYSYCTHEIDLSPGLDTLFRNCHKSSTQRRIRRAERNNVRCVEGRSRSLFEDFYRLLVCTRRRHKIPPQPRAWFENLAECMGDSLKLRLAYEDQVPIAAILTLRHKNVLVYKYGCSDARFHGLGGMQLLFWRTIQEAKMAGMDLFDLGRSSPENLGLNRFKENLGGGRSTITYSRYGRSSDSMYTVGVPWKERVAKHIASYLPDRMLESLGAVLYKHIG